ncbi:hypothetical protein [Paenibacillus sp. BC26]|uniref:hypothetical protein n=1 Tax=Paenibacillus sp. BC26 TaxID=1881032 RepID=UPI0008E534A5|nr:hypothetical protein [Paenibacillus sp. BC26]SFT14310.1 hypothetical protein SAMN05428962_4635 [Paenibacillus sp. BC26]
MENKTYMKLGAVFMITGAAIYTIERCVKLIAYAVATSNSANMDLYANNLGGVGMFFGNFFVWFFLFIGFVLLAFGFPARK